MVRPILLSVRSRPWAGQRRLDNGTADAATSTQLPFLYTQVSINRQRFKLRLPFGIFRSE